VAVRPVRRPPKRRLRPAELRRQKDTRRAVVILAIAVVAVMGVGALLFMTRTPATDPETGCIVGQSTPGQHTVVLIDQTDPLTRTQVAYVKALILAEYERLKPYGELSIRGVRADPDDPGQTFSRCRLRRGTEVSGVTDNPDMVEAAFKRTVGDVLNRYLDSLRNVPTAEHSPIMEAVDNVADSADFGPTVRARRLVIVSDMAQNSDQVSEYRGPGSGLDPSPQARETLKRDLHGVTLRIHYVARPKLAEIQTEAQKEFWRQWFAGQGANVRLGWGLQLVDGRR
jgi:hypothetical protein